MSNAGLLKRSKLRGALSQCSVLNGSIAFTSGRDNQASTIIRGAGVTASVDADTDINTAAAIIDRSAATAVDHRTKLEMRHRRCLAGVSCDVAALRDRMAMKPKAALANRAGMDWASLLRW
jgi:hypothetical protein